MKQETKKRIERINLGEVPEGYKKTKIGVIPKDWEVKKMQYLLSGILNGIFNDPKKVGRGTKLVNVVNLYSEPCIKTDNLELLDVSEKEVKKYLVRAGDLLFTRSSLKLEGVAHCNICLDEKDNLVFDCHIIKATPIKNIINPIYLRFCCLMPSWRKQVMAFAKVTTMATVGQNDIGSIKVPVPPLPEQEKIATILSTWDKAIELKEQYIFQLEVRKKGLMQKLLSGEKRLPGFDGEWEKQKLGNLVTEINTRNSNYQVDKVYSISNKNGFVPQDEQFDKIVASKDISNYKVITKGCIAYNPSRINVGSIAYFDEDFDVVVSPMYIVFKCREKLLSTDFMVQWINGHSFNQQMQVLLSGSVRDSLNFSDLCLIKIKLPSIDEQKAIANILSLADLEISLQKAELETMKLQKKGLMQILLTGKVRVNVNGGVVNA